MTQFEPLLPFVVIFFINRLGFDRISKIFLPIFKFIFKSWTWSILPRFTVLRGQRTILCDCKSDHTIKLCKQGIQCKFPSCRKIRRHPSMSICLTLHLLFFWGGGGGFIISTHLRHKWRALKINKS